MKIVQIALLCTTLLYCGIHAQDSTDTEYDTQRIIADSLEMRADSLQELADELNEQLKAQEIKQTDDTSKTESDIENLKSEIREIHHDIEETAGAIEDAQEDIEDYAEEAAKERKKKKHRGSFILGLHYSELAKEPLKDIVGTMKDIDFDLSNRQILTFGLMGYYANESNVRLGNGLFFGYKSMQSEPYTTTRYDSTANESISVDSFVTLRIIPTSFAFIGEKAFKYESINFFAGIMLGGNLTIIIGEKNEMSNDFFDDTETDTDSDIYEDDETDKKYPVLLSPGVTWDVHGGVAFAMSKNMHIGIDGTLRFTYAYEGFNGVNTTVHTEEFLSITPGVRLRLTFGNAG